ncbi:dihydrodipicolinate synthase family protein [Pelomonas sp. CA6]|uniref:dihydrodipicolinate synthase family protein n=1 Tax=Pelomonas sp. CA6 TaxID=2907999 RepID=UPI001F4BFBBA|nr:dihydrodipicolinate synthase family protein [Pelomonas sp. CA6]MCH7345250.1 dihydrodipicolinate synthase family protein [Pelomonas sp. CA6]
MNDTFPRGNWATLLLPIQPDETIDYESLDEEIRRLIACGVDGIYSNGTAGEFHNQSEAEFDRIHEILARRCHAARMPFQIGVSHPSPWQSLQRLERSIGYAPMAFQVILPDWFPPTEEEQIAFLRRLAAVSASVRLVLYNPPHAKLRLAPAAFGRLKKAVPQLVGVKVPGGDEAWYEQMRQHMRELSVFVPGHLLASGVERGAHGAYSNMACLQPAVAQDWTRLMQTDLPAALALEQRIRRFMQEQIVPFIAERRFANPACDKFLAHLGGWTTLSPRMRWPYRSIPETEAGRVRQAAARLIPEFLQPLPAAALAG